MPWFKDPLHFLDSVQAMERESKSLDFLTNDQASAGLFRQARGTGQISRVDLPWLDVDKARCASPRMRGVVGMMPADSEDAAAQVRPRWVVTPLEGVGPLRFGMTVEDAVAALPEARVLRRFQAGPHFPEVVGVGLAWQPEAPGLYGYFFGSGELFCVAADAVRGPRMTLNEMQLTGGNPTELEGWLFDISDSIGGEVSYGPRANRGIVELGLVLRVQDTADGVLTRPVLVGRDGADRCTDDFESVVPECEWIGRLWPDQRYPDREKWWPSAGHTPAWAGKWSPPF